MKINSKEQLLEILAHHHVFIIDIKDTRDGFVVLPTIDIETDAIFQGKCLQALKDQKFIPVLPFQLKADRSILLFRLNNHIYDNSEEDITNEIYKNNRFTDGLIENIYKFPHSKTIRVTFNSSAIAIKAKNQGLLVFHM